MDVMRDIAILDIRRRNVHLPRGAGARRATSASTSARTRAPTWRRRARGSPRRAPEVSLAEANLATSRAIYRQIIGHDAGRLAGGFPYGRLVPGSSRPGDHRRAERASDHPRLHPPGRRAGLRRQADRGRAAADRQPRGHACSTRRASTPAATRTPRPSPAASPSRSIRAARSSARVRQAKEQYGLRKIEIDLARDQVRAAVVTAWAQVEAARGAIVAAQRRRRGGARSR